MILVNTNIKMRVVDIKTLLLLVTTVLGHKQSKLLARLEAVGGCSVNMSAMVESDRVQRQYQDMPYPAFTPEQMDLERQYYGDNPLEKVPWHHMPTDLLSMINHYLYQVNIALALYG